MKRIAFIAVCYLVLAVPAFGADANDGAKLVQANGCMGCHGAHFEGGVGPALVGIEHRRSAAQIAAAIANPTAPMPKYPFAPAQVDDIVAYLSNLDGGSAHTAPVASISPAKPSSRAVLTIRFPGVPPKHVSAQPVMAMGGSTMSTPKVTLMPTSDPHVWRGTVTFDMGGPWTIQVNYDGKRMNVPVNVAGT